MTSYFDLGEKLCNDLVEALRNGNYARAMRIAMALRRIIACYHQAQHRLGEHLPIDTTKLRKIVEVYVGE